MEWIKTNFALPSKNIDKCIIVDEAGGVYCAEWNNKERGFKEIGEGLPYGGITHWMPLPEPPKQ